MIITALDFNTPQAALELAGKLDPALTKIKVGKELFTLAGPTLVEQLQQDGFDVFLDLKFHDIPNTVAGALKAAASLGVWMVNVHALGGPRMLEAARGAIAPVSNGVGTNLIAVTVLTSMDQRELSAVGLTLSAEEQVGKLAGLAMQCGLDGVVCSPREVQSINAIMGKQGATQFLTVTPGVRPTDGTQLACDDQRRTMTPAQAKQAGSSYVVIGRPITQAKDPLAALHAIQKELDGVER